MTQQYARLTDSQWDQVKSFLPIRRKRKHDLHDVFNAILWITRTGCQWRNLDRQFPPWQDGVAGLDLIHLDFTGQLPRAEKLVGDSAYTGQFAALMQRLDRVAFECSPRNLERRGFVVEPRRWVVERTFAWWNWYHHLIKDYE